MIDARLLAVIAEHFGRELPASIAVNAGRINVEIARYVFRQTQSKLSHNELSLRCKAQSAKLGCAEVVVACADADLECRAVCAPLLEWPMLACAVCRPLRCDRAGT